ncbi:MAG: hypothetical protein V1494_06835 [Candidatus Diapherotrites archaeon]
MKNGNSKQCSKEESNVLLATYWDGLSPLNFNKNFQSILRRLETEQTTFENTFPKESFLFKKALAHIYQATHLPSLDIEIFKENLLLQTSQLLLSKNADLFLAIYRALCDAHYGACYNNLRLAYEVFVTMEYLRKNPGKVEEWLRKNKYSKEEINVFMKTGKLKEKQFWHSYIIKELYEVDIGKNFESVYHGLSGSYSHPSLTGLRTNTFDKEMAADCIYFTLDLMDKTLGAFVPIFADFIVKKPGFNKSLVELHFELEKTRDKCWDDEGNKKVKEN